MLQQFSNFHPTFGGFALRKVS